MAVFCFLEWGLVFSFLLLSLHVHGSSCLEEPFTKRLGQCYVAAQEVFSHCVMGGNSAYLPAVLYPRAGCVPDCKRTGPSECFFMSSPVWNTMCQQESLCWGRHFGLPSPACWSWTFSVLLEIILLPRHHVCSHHPWSIAPMISPQQVTDQLEKVDPSLFF